MKVTKCIDLHFNTIKALWVSVSVSFLHVGELSAWTFQLLTVSILLNIIILK